MALADGDSQNLLTTDRSPSTSLNLDSHLRPGFDGVIGSHAEGESVAVLRAAWLGEKFTQGAIEVHPSCDIVVGVLSLCVGSHGPLRVPDVLDLERVSGRISRIEVVRSELKVRVTLLALRYLESQGDVVLGLVGRIGVISHSGYEDEAVITRFG